MATEIDGTNLVITEYLNMGEKLYEQVYEMDNAKVNSKEKGILAWMAWSANDRSKRFSLSEQELMRRAMYGKKTFRKHLKSLMQEGYLIILESNKPGTPGKVAYKLNLKEGMKK